jgi:CheY-like chemotaxis protein
MNAAAQDVRLTVLYIEDNASNVLLVKRLFRDRTDLSLSTASRGAEGLAMARAALPGLILLDLHLPDIPGTEVLEALRADALTAAIPVVVVSADATLDQIEHLLARGAADYVTKPFEVPRLMAVINSFTGDDDSVLDPARVAELIGLDPDGSTFRSLAASAFFEAANQISAIAEADTPDAVRAAAHSLKSSAAIVGARRVAALADSVEQAARAGSLPDPGTITELRRAVTAAEEATTHAHGHL